MRFFLDINPPTVTAQEKSVRIVGGRPIFYDPTPLKKAKVLLTAHLGKYHPTARAEIGRASCRERV